MPPSKPIQVERRPAEVVDSAAAMGTFIQDLCHRIHGGGSYSSLGITLYIDLEGIDLCRHGSISLMTILVRERRLECDDHWESYTKILESVSILDVKTLGASIFSTAASAPTEEDVDDSGDPSEAITSFSRSTSWLEEVKTLKDILESSDTTKIFFDVRNDADALFAHFGIHLRGTMDLQLLENLSRRHLKENHKFVHGLAKCMQEDSDMSRDQKKSWLAIKEKVRRIFTSKKGYAVFDERPLPPDIITYCIQDVLYMPHLWNVYARKMPRHEPGWGRNVANWRRNVRTATKMRVKEAESASYDPHSRRKTFAPDWAAVVYDPDDSDMDYDPPSPPETGRDFEGIDNSD